MALPQALSLALAVAPAALVATPEDAQVRQDEAVRLQAQAAAAALAGHPQQALEDLRRALALAPDDPLVAYDLALLAARQPGAPESRDVATFLALPPVNADAQLLRAHLLAQAGALGAAREAVDAALAAAPTHVEALAVRALLDQAAAGPARAARFEARARLSGEGDSNVALLAQNAPSHLAGARLSATATALGRPLTGALALDVAAQLRMSYHVNDRAALRDYDLLGATVWAGGRGAVRRTLLSAEATGSLTYAGERGPYFVRDLFAQAEARQAFTGMQPGLFVQAGARDYRRFNDVGGTNDRTGPHLEAGGLLDVGDARLMGGARVSYVAELARGVAQHVQGLTVALSGRAQRGRLRGTLAAAYELRDYDRSREHRRDHRIAPSAQLQLGVAPHLDLIASYVFVANLSMAPFRYTRQIGELGLEGRF